MKINKAIKREYINEARHHYQWTRKDKSYREYVREYVAERIKFNSQQTKPEPVANGASSALDGKERSFVRDKTADTNSLEHSPQAGELTAPEFVSTERSFPADTCIGGRRWNQL